MNKWISRYIRNGYNETVHTYFMNITNIAMLLYLQDFTNIAVLLWNYKYWCTCRILQTLLQCRGITNIAMLMYLQNFTNIAELPQNYKIIAILYICRTYTLLAWIFEHLYIFEHQHGLMNIIFHEIMTVAARLECYNTLY